MSILVYRDANTAATAAAMLIGAMLIERPSSVLGLDASCALSGALAKYEARFRARGEIASGR